MTIGLFFGSFNPIHVGHLIIASYIAETKLVDKVWFVVSPQNPHKPSNSLLNEYNRLHLVNLAIDKDERFKSSNIEFQLPKPSYTIDTLTYLIEKYPNTKFKIIIGSDSLNNLPKWKNYEQLVKQFSFIVYKRPLFEPVVPKNMDAVVVDAPTLHISSTQIRQMISEGKSIEYLVSALVKKEIEDNHYYKN